MTDRARVTIEAIRSYANLPKEVPAALLERHLGIAERDLSRATGLEAAPRGCGDLWDEALIVRVISSAFPWLNTFALNGAAKVGRLEGSIEARFLDAQEVEARVAALNARFETLVSRIVGHGRGDRPVGPSFAMAAV
ncbi:MAG: hypothetical protein V6Z86_06065 [Hyphomicrobiales bacterium]